MTTPLSGYFPAYDGRANADDNLVQPWFIPGWTAQAIAQDSLQANNGISPLGPAFPSNLAFVQITGNYDDTNGSGAGGFLTLMMSDGILVEDSGQFYRLPQRLTGTMNDQLGFGYNNWGNGRLYLRMGQLNIEVFATDQTTSGSTITTDSGAPLTYWVIEHMLGGRVFQITVPSSASPGPADINSLIVPGTVQTYKYDPVNPMGNFLIPVLPPSSVPAPCPVIETTDIDGGAASGGGFPGGSFDGGNS